MQLDAGGARRCCSCAPLPSLSFVQLPPSCAAVCQHPLLLPVSEWSFLPRLPGPCSLCFCSCLHLLTPFSRWSQSLTSPVTFQIHAALLPDPPPRLFIYHVLMIFSSESSKSLASRDLRFQLASPLAYEMSRWPTFILPFICWPLILLLYFVIFRSAHLLLSS